ncbi:tetratricopeptide repeat protein [Xenorhabdus bovienii]|uniref:Putative Bacteriophage protein n=1 Tax=Xenorhabdus bovienii str. kraussei Becker Underwood TaxID=1398204 RepID=A0A077PZ02_XENBV|nr:hypothetical protein [Xenorhabdus bovienii]CDH26433.1 putative Bacteriophage protein [Xenorhabdus bovienii str. kraussei Becker Underwood]
MILPQTKSFEVIEEIRASVEVGENLIGDIAIRRLLKDVEAIPEPGEKLSLKGIIFILQGKTHEGMALCERAIGITPYESAIWRNYCCILNSMGYFSKLKEMILLALENVNKCPQLLNTIAIHASFSADLNLFNQVMLLVDKLNIEPKNIFELRDMEAFCLLSQNGNNAYKLSSLAQELLSVAESNGVKIVRSGIKPDSDGILGYQCTVNTNDIDFICSINDQLFDRIFDKNIDTSGCFAIFEGSD